MTTSIGSVTLDRDMIFDDEFKYSLIRSSVTPTLGGGVVVQEFLVSEKGRAITLVSTESQGMQTKSTVAALLVLANTANTNYSLSISSNSKTLSKTVRFRNEIEGGAVQFDAFHPRQGLHSDTIWYKGTIYLMVMG